MERQNYADMTLEEAQAMERQRGTPEQERQARAAGFKNYAQMRMYMMQRANKTGGTAPEARQTDSGSPNNPLSWHPAQLLSYVQRKWNEAMGN